MDFEIISLIWGCLQTLGYLRLTTWLPTSGISSFAWSKQPIVVKDPVVISHLTPVMLILELKIFLPDPNTDMDESMQEIQFDNSMENQIIFGQMVKKA